MYRVSECNNVKVHKQDGKKHDQQQRMIKERKIQTFASASAISDSASMATRVRISIVTLPLMIYRHISSDFELQKKMERKTKKNLESSLIILLIF